MAAVNDGVQRPGVEDGAAEACGPALIYDPDCSVCTAFVRQLGKRVHPSAGLRLTPSSHWEGPGAEWTDRSAVFHDPREGDAFHVEEQAIGRALMTAGPLPRAVGSLIIPQPLKPLARTVYRTIARNRHQLGCQGSCAIPQPRPGASPRSR